MSIWNCAAYLYICAWFLRSGEVRDNQRVRESRGI